MRHIVKWHRVVTPVATILLYACAGTPTSPREPSVVAGGSANLAASTSEKPAVAAADVRSQSALVAAAIQADPTLTAARIHELSVEGYDLVMRKGQPIFCRNNIKTGSHIVRDSVCMNAAEVEIARANAQRNFGNALNSVAHPITSN